MGFNKFIVALCLMTLTITPVSLAQNSQKDYVAAHNEVRAELGLGPVRWNEKLALYARKYIQTKVETCILEHSNGPYGENLAKGSGEGFSGVDAVKLWADEKPNYDYLSNSCAGGMCGHYTQIIWRDTKEIGCAKTKCKDGWTYISCNYDPPGNYIGERPF
ncbi:pathogenesis-related protein 1 [Ricinus communis]|uniref:STS14 protein, putative n=1 Tax=Ricinus communis TaxID=3988 RepID=B9S7U8_RICCO|nr:pathogenesis-related protein 1 [Ricinus communis]EEF40264.1 STS14 protein precursor, putative [Ricinus communis]|eukprot:XP_002522064.1 pathogenesis-related protein 1 [Ricinus communis]